MKLNIHSNQLSSLFLLLLFLFSGYLSAQNSYSAFSGFWFGVGNDMFINNFTKNDLSTFKKLAPGSNILADVKKDETIWGYYPENGPSLVIFSVDYRIKNKKDASFYKNPVLRLGINYSGQTFVFPGDFQERTTKTIDTLRNSANQPVAIVDSQYTKIVWANYRSQLIGADVAAIFHSSSDNAIRFYVGGGIAFGVSLNASTEIIEYNNNVERYRSINDKGYDFFSFGYGKPTRSELYTNSTATYLNLYLPIGFQARFSRTHDFFSRLNLFVEFRSIMSWYRIPELGNNFFSRADATGGLRYSF